MKKLAGKVLVLLLAGLLAAAAAPGTAEETGTVLLPGEHYTLRVPADMERLEGEEDEPLLFAFVGEDLELDVFAYETDGKTLTETAQELAAEGAETEIREVNGIETLCFHVLDESDGAPGIGYVFADGAGVVELVFWYGTAEAAGRTEEIINTLQAAK